MLSFINAIVFRQDYSVSDLIALSSLIVSTLGIGLLIYQLRKESLRRRAELINSIFMNYNTDSKSVEIFYRIDYGTFELSKYCLNGDEHDLDRFLSHFEKIAILIEYKIIDMNDLSIIAYELTKIANNKSILNYLRRVDLMTNKLKFKSLNNLLDRYSYSYKVDAGSTLAESK